MSKKIIETMKRIVRERQYEEINGVIVDMQTANMITTIYDKLNKKNKKKFSKLNLFTMVNVGWKIIKKSEAKNVKN